MRPQVLTATSIAQNDATAWVPVDNYQTPVNIGLGLVVSTGTWDVQHTFDDVFNTSVTPTAFTHATLTGKTANADGNYAFPIRAVRLKQTGVGSGSATLTILQGRK